MTIHTDWTPERIERLKALWAQGIPASAIGAELGISKSTAIGKAHRLGLAAVARPNHNPLSAKRPPRKLRAQPAVVPDTSRLCTLFELSASTCRWPIDGGYCGHHAAKTYCEYHARLGTSQKRAA